MDSDTGEYDPATTQGTRALYQKIVDSLRADITRGVYSPGALIPSINEISSHWNVSPGTARRALGELVRLGWVRVEATRGHIATAGPAATRTQDTLIIRGQALTDAEPPAAQSTPDALPGGPRPTYTIPLSGTIPVSLAKVQQATVTPEPAPSDVAYALHLTGPGQPVIVRRRTITDAQERFPVELRTSYLPPALAENTPLADPDTDDQPWHDTLAQATGLAPAIATTALEARPALHHEAAALQLPAGATVLIRTSTLHDKSGIPIDHTVSIWPAATTRIIAEAHPLT